MLWSRENHWKLFNLLGRIVGLVFVCGGAVFVLGGAGLVFDKNAKVPVNGVPTNDPAAKSIVLLAGIVVVVLGALLLLARRYQPPDKDA